MKHTLLAFAALLSGCIDWRNETVDLVEPVEVLEVHYQPSTEGHAVGIDMNLNLSVHSYGAPAKYTVVFKCQHGKFIVSRKDVWENAIAGQRGVVRYKETFRVYKDGRRAFSHRSFVRFEPIQ